MNMVTKRQMYEYRVRNLRVKFASHWLCGYKSGFDEAWVRRELKEKYERVFGQELLDSDIIIKDLRLSEAQAEEMGRFGRAL
jgi:hypothetical protein